MTLSPAAQAFELRLWPEQHPLRQFEGQLSHELLRKLEERQLSLDQLAVSQHWLAPARGWCQGKKELTGPAVCGRPLT